MSSTPNFYESPKAISEYLLFHYGDEDLFLLDDIGPRDALAFPRRCAELADRHPLNTRRALDLGCAVGGSACHLSARFDETVGIDFSAGLIGAADSLLDRGSVEIEIAEEGEITRRVVIRPPDVARLDRLRFLQGDAMNLHPSLGTFDFALLGNLIDRLPDPEACLRSIGALLETDGILAITSPYTWLEEFTPKAKWLGGRHEDGQPITTHAALKRVLAPQFEELEALDMPFLIREHARKNQYSIAQATLWRKRSS